MWVYIVLTDTGTWFTKLIKCFTKKPLNHASISFSKDLKETYSFGRKRANNPFVGGFVKEDLTNKLFQNATCAIYRCHVSTKAHVKIQQSVREIEEHKHEYKYNFLGLFGFVINRAINRENAFFCSQFVATMLESGDITIAEKPANLVKPCDFADSEATQLVYAGQLQTYLLKQETIKVHPQIVIPQLKHPNYITFFSKKSLHQIKSAS